MRLLMRRILEGSGYKVVDSSNPVNALHQYAVAPDQFDFVVADVAMPGLSGPRLIEHLSSIRTGVKALYVSGYTNNAIGHLGYPASARRYLRKPFTANELTCTIRDVLDGDMRVTPDP